jgi:hypothetical protein
MSIQTTTRLRDAIVMAGVLIDGVSVKQDGVAASVTVSPPALQAAAQPVINAFDWSQAAQDAFDLTQGRLAASALTSATISTNQLAALVRAVVLLVLDEFNLHTTAVDAILSAVAAATSLADLKTRVALITALPIRTKGQLITALTTKISAGSADS